MKYCLEIITNTIDMPVCLYYHTIIDAISNAKGYIKMGYVTRITQVHRYHGTKDMLDVIGDC